MQTPRFIMMLLAYAALLTFTRCGSDDPTPVAKPEPAPVVEPEPTPVAKPADVYVAGNFNTLAGEGGYNWIPVYWKNGEMVKLSESNGEAELIAVNNGDVYVLGDLDEPNDDTDKKIIWKNGIMTDFSDGTKYVYLYGVRFYGNDMYVVGMIEDRATYWKNGTPHTINTPTESRAYDILVNGADVYVSGFARNNETGYGVATIWKNDEGTDLSDASQHGEVNGLAMLNGDLYANGSDGETAMMWKNNTGTPIGTVGNSGTGNKGIAIEDNVVYIVGEDNDVATLWKNGVATPLAKPAGAGTTSAFEIDFDGDDMFILGEGIVGSNWPVLVWKNNELCTPYDGTLESSAYSMSVARPE